jgi:transposase
MRTKGSSVELEYRRKLAVQRILEGYTTDEVAEFFGIAARSVRRWHSEYQHAGWSALAAGLVPGRPPHLSCTQEKVVRRWLASPATEHGFVTELWSGPRLAQVIAEEFGIAFHPDYLGVWMRQRGYTPQRPQRRAREHNPKAIALWRQADWPRIKKKRLGNGRRWP